MCRYIYVSPFVRSCDARHTPISLAPPPAVVETSIGRQTIGLGGVVVYIRLQAVLLYNTTPIHCTPLPLHLPVMNTQSGQR